MDLGAHDILRPFLVWLLPALPAITLHECAHGWMALYCGDPTARDAKRLSLNPLRHVDPMGTILLPGAMLLLHAPFVFGWAKPVPVNFDLLKNGRVGMILVALAGPLANLVMLLGWLLLLHYAGRNAPPITGDQHLPLVTEIAVYGVGINLVLMLFNLVPIPPLDGSRVMTAILPPALARPYMRLEKFGMIILLVLVGTGLFNRAFQPVLEYFFTRLDRLL